MSDLIPSKSVEQMLGLAVGTLAVLRCRQSGAGLIPYVKVGRSVRYRRDDVEEYVTANTHRPMTQRR
jgi:hypothetical protein